MIKILLVDDHDLVRVGMRHIIATRPEFEVVGEADCGEQALVLLQRQPVDLVLMDLNMPGMGGIEATRRITAAYPDTRVIALTALSEDPFPNSLHKAGALGYISKGCTPQELFKALVAVGQGRPFISTEVAQNLSISGIRGRETNPLSLLSGRELDVLMLLLANHSQQEIAELLDLKPRTVRTYLHRVRCKLDVDTDLGLFLLCLRHGLLKDRSNETASV
ncbi:MAG: response regulator [Gammaproteobacteria bacterium SHHR-1]|uniref:response regulator n=1 Tax=Magnetovirga frankeli TaxID=947516 RepID=UPI001293FD89|nr:response regulator [gamma proteobacterium SS-5]